MKKDLLVAATSLILTIGSVAVSTPVYNSDGPPGSFHQGKQSTYDSMKTMDRSLSGEARRALEQDEELSPQAKNINIKVKNRQATVSGTVQSKHEIDVILKKVSEVQGIDSVTNKLKVHE